MQPKSDDSGTSVIARAAQLLQTIKEYSRGLTIAALSRYTGMPRNMVHRLVNSLEAKDLLLSEAGLIRLGPALTRLAASAYTDVFALARTPMEMLGRRKPSISALCVAPMRCSSVNMLPIRSYV